MTDIHTCPLCGNKKTTNSKVCKDCKNIKLAYSQNQLAYKSHVSSYAPAININALGLTMSLDSQSQKKSIIERGKTLFKKRKQSKIMIPIVIFLLLLGSLFAMNLYSGSKQEQLLWGGGNSNDTELYTTYLLQYPDGIYADEAEARLRYVKEKELSDKIKLEYSMDINDHLHFLEVYPNTLYKGEVNERIDFLKWKSAEANDSKEAYQNYLTEAENGNTVGNFFDLATDKIAEIDSLTKLEN